MDNEMTPFTVVNSNGTCPDTFMVTVEGGMYAEVGGIKFIHHRNEGETDEDFWNRALAGVANLLIPLPVGHTPKHAVIVTCLYESFSSDSAPAYPAATFKGKGKRK